MGALIKWVPPFEKINSGINQKKAILHGVGIYYKLGNMQNWFEKGVVLKN